MFDIELTFCLTECQLNGNFRDTGNCWPIVESILWKISEKRYSCDHFCCLFTPTWCSNKTPMVPGGWSVCTGSLLWAKKRLAAKCWSRPEESPVAGKDASQQWWLSVTWRFYLLEEWIYVPRKKRICSPAAIVKLMTGHDSLHQLAATVAPIGCCIHW